MAMLFLLSHYIQFLNREHKVRGGCLACGQSDPVFRPPSSGCQLPRGAGGRLTTGGGGCPEFPPLPTVPLLPVRMVPMARLTFSCSADLPRWVPLTMPTFPRLPWHDVVLEWVVSSSTARLSPAPGTTLPGSPMLPCCPVNAHIAWLVGITLYSASPAVFFLFLPTRVHFSSQAFVVSLQI